MPPIHQEAEALLDDAACGLLQIAFDGTILRANRVFAAWLGHRKADLVGKRRFQDLLTMGGRIFTQTHWAPLLEMQGSVSEVKLEFVHRDGQSIPMVINAISHEDYGDTQGRSQGRPVCEIAAYIAHDRDKYERQLIESRKRLEVAVGEANRLQAEAKDRAAFAEQMIAIVSHDLKNPLSTVKMGTDLLARGSLNVDQQRVLSLVTRAAERADRLIIDLLDFAQARLGKGLPVAQTVIAVHDVVGDTVDELTLAYPGRRLEHRRFGEGGCLGDRNRLAQLVTNLVANAMAYGSPQTLVTVTTTITQEGFSIGVHNQGDPIPAEALDSLFQPMVRGAHVGGDIRSVGLGLFIVGEIVKAHGGRTQVTSTEQDGTTFLADFPRTSRIFSGQR
ncbi:MAG TPA: PAS domain-containing sensor histidine kinase [Polyangia bacterium]